MLVCRTSWGWGLCAALMGLPGCDEAEGEDEETDPLEALCGDASRYDELVVGLSKTGAQCKVSFVDAQPSPPIRDYNAWTLKVESDDGAPLEDVAWEVFPWMPDHGHGSPTPIVVSPGDQPGEYVLDPVDLIMAGLWTIDLTLILPEDRGVDTVQFAFCVQ